MPARVPPKELLVLSPSRTRRDSADGDYLKLVADEKPDALAESPTPALASKSNGKASRRRSLRNLHADMDTRRAASPG